jgi:hypothetical protein
MAGYGGLALHGYVNCYVVYDAPGPGGLLQDGRIGRMAGLQCVLLLRLLLLLFWLWCPNKPPVAAL